jgi:tRNA A-37 threonylcarbamoyl transferase component Bud32
MKRCPECGKSFEDELTHCPDDGVELVERPTPKDPFIGRILAVRYEVLELLGRGGFGVVYKVLDRKMDDVVAVKVFDRRRFTDEEAHQAVQRFRREGVLLRRLGKRTNNIVIVYDFEEDEEEELIYFTMDFVDGVTLTKVLADEGPPSLPRALDLALQICQALKAAHAEGIVHRDLKLENVMITRDGDREIVKVLDFGIAKMVGSQSLTNLAMGVPGTAGFAPPEQLQRPQDIDHRTDLFSMGVVLYGLVTGHGPWSGEPISEPTSSEKIWDLIRSSLEEAPIPMKRWTSEVPKRLETVILTLLEKDQAKRIQSAEILEEELKKVRRSLTGEPDTGKGFGPLGAFGTLSRRLGVHPAVAIGGLAAVLVGAAVTLWALSGTTPTIPMGQFLAAAYADRILEAGFSGDHLEAVLREEGGEVGDVRVGLQGVSVQELARDLRDRGIHLRVEGRAGFRALAMEEASGGARSGGSGAAGGFNATPSETPAAGALVFLDGPDDACSPCAPGQELRLASGWYDVRASGEEWVLQGLLLQDEEGVFQEEVVDQAEPTIFLPEDASMALISIFAPTPARTRLTEAGTAIAAGDPEGALAVVGQVLAETPEHSWALALRDTVLFSVRSRAVAVMESSDPEDAERWLPTCRTLDAGDPECGRVEGWLEIRRQADWALQGNRLAEAVELADRCLDLSAADADCTRIRQDGRARLAAAQQRPPERPAMARPAPARTDPAPGARTDPPPPTEVQPAAGVRTDPGVGARPDSAAPARTDSSAAARTDPRTTTAGVDSARATPVTGGAPPAAGATSQPEGSPALSVSGLTIRGYRFADNQFLVDASFSAVGPGDAPLCVASVFGNQDREPYPDRDGEMTLGGWVAVTEAHTPGTTPGPATVRHVLPVGQLHVDRGTVRVVATTRIWRGSCDAADPSAPPLAQTFTEAICIARYPAGWGVCRNE